jgi:hypothetical protein
MPFPTSSYGQPNWSDVYTAIPPGSGLQPGSTELLFDGSFVQFLLFSTSGVAGAGMTGIAPWANTYSIATTTTANVIQIWAINDRNGGGLGTSNATVASTSYAWCTIKGLAFPFTTASTAALKYLVSSGTAGLLAAATAGTSLQANIWNTVVVGGSNAQSPALFQ